MCGHIASPHLLWGFCLHPEKAVQDQKASPLPAASRGADPGIGLVGRGASAQPHSGDIAGGAGTDGESWDMQGSLLRGPEGALLLPTPCAPV